MTDDSMTAVPTVLIEALAKWWSTSTGEVSEQVVDPIDAIIACLPKPPPVFSDEVIEAFFRAEFPTHYTFTTAMLRSSRDRLTHLYDNGWLTPTDDGSFIITPPKETS